MKHWPSGWGNKAESSPGTWPQGPELQLPGPGGAVTLLLFCGRTQVIERKGEPRRGSQSERVTAGILRK